MKRKNFYEREESKLEISSVILSPEKREIAEKEREEASRKLFLGEIFEIEKPELSNNNMFLAPVGSGKTYFIEEKLIPKDYNGTILYLVSNTALKDSVAPPSSEVRKKYAELGRSKGFFTTQNTESFGDVPYKVHVMTYHEFGYRVFYPNEDLTKNINLVFCDEIHSLPVFITYGDCPGLFFALKWLFGRHEGKQIFYFTATKDAIDKLEKRYPGYTSNVKVFNYLNYPNIMQYVPKSTFYISNIQQLRMQLRARKEYVNFSLSKGMAFTKKIENQEKISELAKEEGYEPIVIWSVNNEEKELTEEQKRVRTHILETGFIPEPYNLLIINGSMQEGWNLFDDKVEFAILDTLDETERTQALGRIRKDIDFLVLRTDNKVLVEESQKTVVNLDDKYLNRYLSKEEREEVAQFIGVTNHKGYSLKWRSAKKLLIDSGYNITDQMMVVNGERRSFSLISL